MVFTDLCPPALIYLVFSITQIVIDSVKGLYNTALIKIWVAFIFTILLNYLCQLGLGIISWFIVFIPFVLMTIIVAILLLMFGLDPSTGKIKVKKPHQKHHKHGKRFDDTHGHHPPNPPDKPVGKGEDDILNYYNPSDYSLGGGGGGSSLDSDTKNTETKKEKDNRILARSLLFYSDEVIDNKDDIQNGKKKGDSSTIGGTDYDSGEYLDTSKYKSTISSITITLNDMGEHDIAVWFENSALECLNSVNGMKKAQKVTAINKCFNDLLSEVEVKFNKPEVAAIFKNNMQDTICHQNRHFDEIGMCTSKTGKSWWK